MANGRAIKRKMAKAQGETQGALSGGPQQGIPQPDQEFMQGAQEGAGYEGRQEHLMTLIDPKDLEEVPPEMRDQLEVINGAILDMMYNPKTKEGVQQMLQEVDPVESIPKATNMVLSQFENFSREGQGEMPLEMKFAAGLSTFNEVMEMAQGMGVVPKELPESDMEGLMKTTMEQYIIAGLKDKTIDPVELQLKVEPLLTPEEQMLARGAGQEMGMPGRPTQQMTQQQNMSAATRPIEAERDALKEQNTQMNTALQRVALGGQEEGA